MAMESRTPDERCDDAAGRLRVLDAMSARTRNSYRHLIVEEDEGNKYVFESQFDLNFTQLPFTVISRGCQPWVQQPFVIDFGASHSVNSGWVY
jgi:hypothetical protein